MGLKEFSEHTRQAFANHRKLHHGKTNALASTYDDEGYVVWLIREECNGNGSWSCHSWINFLTEEERPSVSKHLAIEYFDRYAMQSVQIGPHRGWKVNQLTQSLMVGARGNYVHFPLVNIRSFKVCDCTDGDHAPVVQ